MNLDEPKAPGIGYSNAPSAYDMPVGLAAYMLMLAVTTRLVERVAVLAVKRGETPWNLVNRDVENRLAWRAKLDALAAVGD